MEGRGFTSTVLEAGEGLLPLSSHGREGEEPPGSNSFYSSINPFMTSSHSDPPPNAVAIEDCVSNTRALEVTGSLRPR